MVENAWGNAGNLSKNTVTWTPQRETPEQLTQVCPERFQPCTAKQLYWFSCALSSLSALQAQRPAADSASREGNALLGFVETKRIKHHPRLQKMDFLKARLDGCRTRMAMQNLTSTLSQWPRPWKSGFRMKMRAPGLCHVTTGAEQEPAAKPLVVKHRNFVCLGAAISCKTRALSAKEQSPGRRFMPS